MEGERHNGAAGPAFVMHPVRMRPRRKKMTVAEALKPVEYTSQDLFHKIDIHPAPVFYDSWVQRNYTEFAIWTVIFVVSVVLLCQQLYQVIDSFMDNPVLTNYDIILPPEGLKRPDIVFCPPLHYHMATWNRTNVDPQWERQYIIDNPYFVPNRLSNDKGDTILEEYIGMHERDQSSNGSNGTGELWRPKDEVEYLHRVGYPLDTFLAICKTDDGPIDCGSVATPVVHWKQGKCFHISFAGTAHEYQVMSGSRDGLKFLLNIDPLNAFSRHKVPLIDGVKMWVGSEFGGGHEPESILLSPNSYTSVRLSQRVTVLMNRPKKVHGHYKDSCVEDTTGILKMFNTSYHSRSCFWDCYTKTIYETCQCVMPMERSMFNEEYQSIAFCTREQMAECVCAAHTTAEHSIIYRPRIRRAAEACVAGCPKVCESTKVKPTHISAARFPSAYVRGAETTQALWVAVTFDEIEYEKVVQSPSMTWNSFIGTVGGQMGLWIGASIVSLLKIAVITTVLACNSCSRRFRSTAPAGVDASV